MKKNLLILILQNLVLFPNQEIKLELSNETSKEIIDESVSSHDSEVIVVSSKDEEKGSLDIKDIEKIGGLCKIKACLVMPNGNIRVTLRGIKRQTITKIAIIESGKIEVECENVQTPEYNLDEELAYSRKLRDLVTRYVEVNSKVSNSILGVIKNVTNLSKITDMITAFLELDYKQKNKLFKEVNYYKRARLLTTILTNEIKSLELEMKIDEEVRKKFESGEKEIIIKEKIRALSNEIGIDIDKHDECENFLSLISKMKVDDKIKKSLRAEVKRFEMTLDSSPEYGSLRAHLEFVTGLPWNKSTKDESDIEKASEHLNGLHYGLDAAKTRIEEYLQLKSKNKSLHSPILCLIGPPGTGKTTFARELAGSIGREFVKVSVGGLNDSSELVGHRRTYIGAGPGKIMEGIKKCGVDNPVILIDEVDKMVKDYKGDPSSVLLEILDQNQNKEFIDNYIQEPFNLSNVLFILTANDESKIPRALYDRLEVIEVASYTLFDKVEIAKNYTLPRLGKEYGFDHTKIKMSEAVITKIIEEYTRESGVRDLERKISSILRKILIKGLDEPVTIRETDLEKYLGKRKYTDFQNIYETSGVANVPACTNLGGCVLNIEVSIYPGCEKIVATGSLGKIMQESTSVVMSYFKKNAKAFHLDRKDLMNTVHIHALEGALPKEGPSGGLAIAVAVLSELLDVKIPNDIAFTGEMSLKGRILKVGGIKEKLISLANAGLKRIYLPNENAQDLDNIPKKVLKKIDIVLVNDFTEVYNDLFE